ncbi:YraN family protein [Methylococcus sp. EFPC2]|uniref:YraN family protein n=1 Tax=Methylococcus sp. EFPC2 TaxID=2812648 RepID=UPI0019672355|nr:YraN family protein [Methylococcus sp. EFPC2]QSA97051.1 YraN family protein [Methylococcus sp. EFPC2]
MKPDGPAHLVAGRRAEDEALAYLQAHGLKLIERNYRCRQGEIDLVMEEGNGLVFVEVRYRADPRYGSALESVGGRKRTRLIAAASHYLATHRADRPARFDVIGLQPEDGKISTQWIKNAFSAF